MINRKHKLGVLGSLGIALVAATSLAGGALANYEKVTLIQISGNTATVSFTADLAGGPGCASSNRNQISFDASTTIGQGRLALFQGALLSGKTVRVTGSGSCTGSVETLSWLGAAD